LNDQDRRDKKEGNFLWWRPGCVVGTPATLPNSAFQALQAQIAAGLPPTLPTQLAALVPTTHLGLGGILGGLGGLGGLGAIIVITTQNNNNPVTGD
jgi:hypothetical protein